MINTFGNEYIVTIFQLSHSYFLLSICNHVNEQCIFAKYVFYDIINNQYYEYHVHSKLPKIIQLLLIEYAVNY